MPSLLLSGTAHPSLARSIAQSLSVELGQCRVERFPDGEVQVELGEDVREREVFLVQPTRPPVGEHLIELFLLADACRRSGARRITAITPYFGYARQDRRESGREPLGARVVADLFAHSGIDRVVVMDLHSGSVEGCFKIPMVHLSAMGVLAEKLRAVPRPAVVVSPDLGAVKLAERYARALGLPVAIVHKQRLTGSEVSARGVVGEVKGHSPIVIDDMISTAGTMAAAVEAVLAAGCTPNVTLAATHGLFVGPAAERLAKLPLRAVVTSDTVPASPVLPCPHETASVASLLADAVRQLGG